MNIATPMRAVQRVRHELRLRDVVVQDVQRPRPGFVAVTFAGPDLRDFPSASFDDHVKFIFTTPAGEVIRRDMTPRSFDTGEARLTLEFALHDAGAASHWAAHATPGQQAVIGGPRGSMIVPMDYDWHLLAGDSSALPAILRRLEELPVGRRAVAVLELPAPLSRESIRTRADLQLVQVPSAADWMQCLKDLPELPGTGYAWCATEAGLASSVRSLWLETRGIPRERAKISAYWKRGTADFHE